MSISSKLGKGKLPLYMWTSCHTDELSNALNVTGVPKNKQLWCCVQTRRCATR